MTNKLKQTVPPSGSPKKAQPRWLWPTLAGVVAVVFIAGVIWLAQPRQPSVTHAPQVAGQPSASIDRTNFDYGDVKLGSTIQTVFHVKNVGDKELAFQGQPRVELREGC